MLKSTRSLFRPVCQSSVLRVGESVWFDTSRPVTKVSAALHTYVIPAAQLTTHVQLSEAKTGLIISCRNRSANMTWGEEAPSAVAAALPHYAQVVAFYLLWSRWGEPLFCQGPIVKGFGRGSTELGFPTANFSDEVIDLWLGRAF